LVADKS